MAELHAPFPFYGGKRRWASLIWERLGNPTVYAEPFAGSLACLLQRPGGAGIREIVCDTDGGICNFWRAVSNDPHEVAYWADYPTIPTGPDRQARLVAVLGSRQRQAVEYRPNLL